MIYLRVKDLQDINNSDYLINSFPFDFSIPKSDNEKNENFRFFRKKSNLIVLEICVIGERKLINNNKTFNSLILSLEAILKNLLNINKENLSKLAEKKANELADEFLHNLRKIHGNQKSIIERCIENAEGQIRYTDFVSAVEKDIISLPRSYAEDICALSKEIRLIDYHLGGYDLLRSTSLRPNITHNHNLKKFLLGISHLFFESLRKNDVVLSLHDVDNSFSCAFEYETFNIAMHSFIENITKYAKPGTSVHVFTNRTNQLIFEMESVRIEKEEIDLIFERGVFGFNSPEHLRGSGIGLYQLKKALDRSNITIKIYSEFSTMSTVNNVKYVKNIFTFTFPS